MILHVIPIKDSINGERFYHKAHHSCRCFPLTECNEYGCQVIHNAFDLREKYERQNAVPPSAGWTAVEEHICNTE